MVTWMDFFFNEKEKASWWFQRFFFIFTPKIGEDEPIFDDHIFQKGIETTN